MTPKWVFPQELAEGIIRSRPNRFIMYVELDGGLVKSHCPVTGRIGDLVFDEIPCLLSKSDSPGRKTQFTVEAISLDPVDKAHKSWVGINQTKANDYVDFFLRSGSMLSMTGNVETVKREVGQGNSRIDYLVNGSVLIEVKTLLFDLPCQGHPSCRAQHGPLTSFDRLIKHLEDVSRALATGSSAILLLCYLYDAKPFEVPTPNPKTFRIREAAREAYSRGLEHWQLNLRIDKQGVEFTRCFKLHLFSS
jgi:sugar fermentation stimulation protein A